MRHYEVRYMDHIEGWVATAHNPGFAKAGIASENEGPVKALANLLDVVIPDEGT